MTYIWLLDNVKLKRNYDKQIESPRVNDTEGSDFGDFRIHVLGEYEAICKIALARE
jgi:hypothetical protein